LNIVNCGKRGKLNLRPLHLTQLWFLNKFNFSDSLELFIIADKIQKDMCKPDEFKDYIHLGNSEWNPGFWIKCTKYRGLIFWIREIWIFTHVGQRPVSFLWTCLFGYKN
jgi:hypothetical protein